MKRVEMEVDQMPGQDSFLDVITNIVGILILLVLVVGLRSSHSVHDAIGGPAADSTIAQEQLEKAFNTARTGEKETQDLIRRVGSAHNEADFREVERGWLSTAVAQAEKEIADRRAKLGTDGQRDFDLRQKLKEAQSALDDLTREQIALMS